MQKLPIQLTMLQRNLQFNEKRTIYVLALFTICYPIHYFHVEL